MGNGDCNVLKNAEANGAVRFHQGIFGAGQSTRFAKYLCRHSDLANVVNDCGKTKYFKSLCAQSELGPNGDGQIRNAILVLDRERIPITVGGRKNCDAWTE